MNTHAAAHATLLTICLIIGSAYCRVQAQQLTPTTVAAGSVHTESPPTAAVAGMVHTALLSATEPVDVLEPELPPTAELAGVVHMEMLQPLPDQRVLKLDISMPAGLTAGAQPQEQTAPGIVLLQGGGVPRSVDRHSAARSW